MQGQHHKIQNKNIVCIWNNKTSDGMCTHRLTRTSMRYILHTGRGHGPGDQHVVRKYNYTKWQRVADDAHNFSRTQLHDKHIIRELHVFYKFVCHTSNAQMNSRIKDTYRYTPCKIRHPQHIQQHISQGNVHSGKIASARSLYTHKDRWCIRGPELISILYLSRLDNTMTDHRAGMNFPSSDDTT